MSILSLLDSAEALYKSFAITAGSSSPLLTISARKFSRLVCLSQAISKSIFVILFSLSLVCSLGVKGVG